MAKGGELYGAIREYRPAIISLKEAGYSANPGEDMEEKHLRLPGDLVVVESAKEIPA